MYINTWIPTYIHMHACMHTYIHTHTHTTHKTHNTHAHAWVEEKCGYCVAGSCLTDVVLHSLDDYHQKHSAEPLLLPQDVAAASIVVVLCFLRVSSLLTLYTVCRKNVRKRQKSWPINDAWQSEHVFMAELNSAQLIIELLRNEVSVGTEVSRKQCDVVRKMRRIQSVRK